MGGAARIMYCDRQTFLARGALMCTRGVVWSIVAAASLWILIATQSEAAGIRYRVPPTAAQVQAAKVRLAARIQRQVDAARRVLKSADKQAQTARSTIN